MNKQQKRLIDIAKHFDKFRLLKLLDTTKIKMYRFADPESNNLSQNWIIEGGRVIVTGDAGDAIYAGGGFGSLDKIANSSIQYFTGKCIASVNGRSQSKWDSDVATESIHYMIFEHFEEKLNYCEDDPSEIKLSMIEDFTDSSWGEYIPRSFDDEWDTVTWLREHSEHIGFDFTEELYFTEKTNEPFWHLAAIKKGALQKRYMNRSPLFVLNSVGFEQTGKYEFRRGNELLVMTEPANNKWSYESDHYEKINIESEYHFLNLITKI